VATKQEIRDYFAKFGKEGGKTRAKNMTPEQRSASAKKAVEARWAKLDKINKTLDDLEAKQKNRRTKKKASKDGLGQNG
jgi:ubiquinone biosynthesis protein UbiJ